MPRIYRGVIMKDKDQILLEQLADSMYRDEEPEIQSSEDPTVQKARELVGAYIFESWMTAEDGEVEEAIKRLKLVDDQWRDNIQTFNFKASDRTGNEWNYTVTIKEDEPNIAS